MVGPDGVVQKTYIIHPRTHSPDALAKYIMCLDGAWEVWLDQMVEDLVSNMQNPKAEDGKIRNKKRGYANRL